MSSDGNERAPRATDVAKAILLPPAGLFWLALLGLALVFAGETRAGLLLAVLGLGSLFLLSLPGVAGALVSRLDRHPPFDPAGYDPTEPTAIVVLDAGRRPGAAEYGADGVRPMTLERLAYAAWLWRRLELPILVTGNGAGSLMATYLDELFDVPVRWIEPASHNTHENAVRSAEILRREEISRVVVVTHYWHMPRAAAAFSAAGLTVVPAPMDFARHHDRRAEGALHHDRRAEGALHDRRAEGALHDRRAEGALHDRWESGLLLFVPSTVALVRSYLAFHEAAGLFWYRRRYGRRPFSSPRTDS